MSVAVEFMAFTFTSVGAYVAYKLYSGIQQESDDDNADKKKKQDDDDAYAKWVAGDAARFCHQTSNGLYAAGNDTICPPGDDGAVCRDDCLGCNQDTTPAWVQAQKEDPDGFLQKTPFCFPTLDSTGKVAWMSRTETSHTIPCDLQVEQYRRTNCKANKGCWAGWKFSNGTPCDYASIRAVMAGGGNANVPAPGPANPILKGKYQAPDGTLYFQDPGSDPNYTHSPKINKIGDNDTPSPWQFLAGSGFQQGNPGQSVIWTEWSALGPGEHDGKIVRRHVIGVRLYFDPSNPEHGDWMGVYNLSQLDKSESHKSGEIHDFTAWIPIIWRVQAVGDHNDTSRATSIQWRAVAPAQDVIPNPQIPQYAANWTEWSHSAWNNPNFLSFIKGMATTQIVSPSTAIYLTDAWSSGVSRDDTTTYLCQASDGPNCHSDF